MIQRYGGADTDALTERDRLLERALRSADASSEVDVPRRLASLLQSREREEIE